MDLQNQESSSLQKQQSGIQDTSSNTGIQPFTQDQLVAPQLRVGSTTVRPSGSNTGEVSSGRAFNGVGFAVIVIVVIAVFLIAWALRQSDVAPSDEVEETLPEVAEADAVAPVRAKRKKKSKQSGRKKARR